MQHSMMHEHAIWLAAVFGPFLLVQALWILFYHDNAAKVLTSLKSTPAVFHLLGLLNFLFGLVLVTTYNVWAMNVWVFVTLFGWLLLLRGVCIWFVPQLIIKSMNYKSLRVWGVVQLIWGIILCWAAFWMG